MHWPPRIGDRVPFQGRFVYVIEVEEWGMRVSDERDADCGLWVSLPRQQMTLGQEG